MLHSINHEQRLYVLKHGACGYTCLGFEVAERKRQAVLAWAHATQDDNAPLGTEAHYNAYTRAMDIGYVHHGHTQERCPAELEPLLIGCEGWRVEVTAPDGYKERFIVSKSTGWMPCHLALKKRNSMAGGAAYLPQDAQVRRLEKVY